MATPRKHWWRVSDEVAYEPWSNDVAATFLRLGAHLNTRWAREGRNAADACQVTLSRGTALQLTGSGSLTRARSILRELATSITLVIDEQGTNTSVRWPKFAEFQKYESGPRVATETDGSSAVPPPQDAPAPAPARRKTQEEPPVVPLGGPARKASRRLLTESPDALSSDDMNALLEWACDAEPTQAHRVEALVQECLDHFRGEGKKKQDWIATCRNWIRRDRQYREQRGGARGNGLRPGPISQAIRNITARDAARDRARAGREDADAEQAVLDVHARRE